MVKAGLFRGPQYFVNMSGSFLTKTVAEIYVLGPSCLGLKCQFGPRSSRKYLSMLVSFQKIDVRHYEKKFTKTFLCPNILNKFTKF